MLETINPVCSHKPRPAVHSGRKGGNQWWVREVFHADDGDGRTLCGTKCDEWLTMDPRPIDEALEDTNLCKRCATILHPWRTADMSN